MRWVGGWGEGGDAVEEGGFVLGAGGARQLREWDGIKHG